MEENECPVNPEESTQSTAPDSHQSLDRDVPRSTEMPSRQQLLYPEYDSTNFPLYYPNAPSTSDPEQRISRRSLLPDIKPPATSNYGKHPYGP